MKKTCKRCMGLIIGMMLMILQINILAVDVPNTIQIGLESIYKDADRVAISSDSDLVMGHTSSGKFKEEGRLESKAITIKRDFSTYYELDKVFVSLEEAKAVARSYNGFPVYVEAGFYKVYKENQLDNFDITSVNNKRIAVYNEANELILIAENDTMPLEIQGIDFDYNFPVTTVGSRAYRGTISVVNGQSKGLTAVNTVDMEDYLYGVIPAEMAPSWPIEALKVQAVAARSMAIYQYNRHVKKGYNLVDTVTSQVYKGVTIENPRTTEAVDTTRGEVVTYDGKIAETLYFSTSGGYTESAENVWGNKVPYLVAKPDLHETKPEAGPWIRKITLEELQRCIDAKGANIGRVEGAKIVSKTSSGRVGQLDILGSKGTYTLTGEDIRSFFSRSNEGSLKSRLFNFGAGTNTNSGQIVDSNEVSIMSSNNVISSNLKDTYMMSGTDIKQMGQEVILQGAYESKKISTVIKEPVSQGSEVVYGDLTIYGQGFGHGVGMSQSGARGMAEAGYSYEEILKYYYTGVEIER